jgi:hypothetical protein
MSIYFQIRVILEFYAACISSLLQTFATAYQSRNLDKKNYHSTLRIIPEEHRSRLRRGRKPKITQFHPVPAVVKHVQGSLCAPHGF